MQAGLEYSARRWLYLIMRLIFCAAIIASGVRGALSGWLTADFLFFVLVAVVWFAVTFLLDFGMRRFQWQERWYDLLLVCLDVYFLAFAMSLTRHTAGLAVLGMAFYSFIIAIISTPPAAFLAGMSGMVAFITSFPITGHWPQPGVMIAGAGVLAAVVCGTAWRLCLPLVWKAVRFYLHAEVAGGTAPAAASPPADVSPAPQEAAPSPAAPSAPSGDSAAPQPADAASEEKWKKMLAEKDQALAELQKEKDTIAAELAKTTEELMKLFENAGVSQSGGDDNLRRQLAEKEKALAELQKEKEALAKELEKTNEELMRMFRVG